METRTITIDNGTRNFDIKLNNCPIEVYSKKIEYPTIICPENIDCKVDDNNISIRERDTNEKSETIKIGGMTINSCNNIGQINICSGNGKMKINYASGAIWHGDYIQGDKIVNVSKEGKNITIDGHKINTYPTSSDDDSLKIEIPEHSNYYALIIKSGNGDINISNLLLEYLEIKTKNSKINLKLVHSPYTRLISENGEINAEFQYPITYYDLKANAENGSLSIDPGSSTVEAKQLEKSYIKAYSKDGNIKLSFK